MLQLSTAREAAPARAPRALVLSTPLLSRMWGALGAELMDLISRQHSTDSGYGAQVLPSPSLCLRFAEMERWLCALPSRHLLSVGRELLTADSDTSLHLPCFCTMHAVQGGGEQLQAAGETGLCYGSWLLCSWVQIPDKNPQPLI